MDMGSYVVQAGLKFITYVSMTLIHNAPAFCLPRSGIAGVYHPAWFYVVVGIEPMTPCIQGKHSTH